MGPSEYSTTPPNDPKEQLKGRAQIDFLKMLSAIIRKYGNDGVIEITPQDLAPVKGGLRREIDQSTGTIRYTFEKDT